MKPDLRLFVVGFLGGVSVCVAWQAISGWALPIASFSIWGGSLALIAMSGVFWKVPRADDPPSAVAVSEPPSPILVDAAMYFAKERAWYRLLADIVVHFNERYPREGICVTQEFDLRKGDHLLLLLVRDEGRSGGPHPCDFEGRWDGGQLERYEICVGTRIPHRIAIERDGVYALGVCQGDYGKPTSRVRVLLETVSPLGR